MTTALPERIWVEEDQDIDMHFCKIGGWGQSPGFQGNHGDRGYLFGKAFAEKMVLAYNSHDALVEALKEAKRSIGLTVPNGKTLKIIEAALALAERTEA